MNTEPTDAELAAIDAEQFVEHVEAVTTPADRIRLRAERRDLADRIDLAENLLGLAVFAADAPRINLDLATLQRAWRDAREYLDANPNPEREHGAA